MENIVIRYAKEEDVNGGFYYSPDQPEGFDHIIEYVDTIHFYLLLRRISEEKSLSDGGEALEDLLGSFYRLVFLRRRTIRELDLVDLILEYLGYLGDETSQVTVIKEFTEHSSPSRPFWRIVIDEPQVEVVNNIYP